MALCKLTFTKSYKTNTRHAALKTQLRQLNTLIIMRLILLSGILATIIVASMLGLLLIITLVWCLLRKR